MSRRGRSGYISVTISTSVGNLVVGIGFIFIQKVHRVTYSYLAQQKYVGKINNNETMVRCTPGGGGGSKEGGFTNKRQGSDHVI